jgi:outer membrane protein
MKGLCRRTAAATLVSVTLWAGACLAGEPASRAEAQGAGVLSLSEGLRLATENSRVVKIAAREREMASADADAARSFLLPSVNASASETFLAYQPGASFGTVEVDTAERQSLAYGLSIRQTLYDFGGNRSRYEASKASLEASGLSLDFTRNRVALDFIVAYFDLLETDAMVEVEKKEVQRLQSHLDVASSLYQEGVITKNDLLQAEVRLSDARQRLLNVRNLRSVNAARINNILSRPAGTPVQVEEVAGNLPAVRYELDAAWETAMERNMQLKIIDRELAAAALEQSAVKAQYYPEFFALGAYDYTQNKFQLHQDNWSLVVGVNINLYSGGRTRAEAQKAIYRQQRLRELRQKTLDDIKLEVERNYLGVENARKKMEVTRAAVGQAEENLRINEARYAEGVGTATDVLDAVTLLTTAETNYQSAQYDLRRESARLMFNMGLDMVSIYHEGNDGGA